MISFTRKVHKALAKSTQENCVKAGPICTSSTHNKYELFSVCYADSSCVCMSQAGFMAANNHTVFSFAACGAVRVGRTMKSRQNSPDHKRRRSERKMERPPIPRSSGGSSQDCCKVTFNQPMSGLRNRTTISFAPGDATLNATAHHWVCCPDPPLI